MNWQDKAMAATRGTQLGAIVACALGRETAAPYFSGKASVTSDGFIMCNFTGADGRNHLGAFVGSLNDLERNAVGLAKHLDLGDEDRAAFARLLLDWIGTGYCNDAVRRAAARLRAAVESFS